MGWFDGSSHEDSYNTLQNEQPHEAKFSHELVAGAAAFEAAKAYEKHCQANGKPESHAVAKELLAGFAAAFVDREVETKGMDWIDKEKAKKQAQQNVQEVVVQEYNVDY